MQEVYSFKGVKMNIEFKLYEKCEDTAIMPDDNLKDVLLETFHVEKCKDPQRTLHWVSSGDEVKCLGCGRLIAQVKVK